MNIFILTTWLCLSSTPTCPANHSATGPIVNEWAGREECESVQKELLALNPPPPGFVVRHSCEPKGQGL